MHLWHKAAYQCLLLKNLQCVQFDLRANEHSYSSFQDRYKSPPHPHLHLTSYPRTFPAHSSWCMPITLLSVGALCMANPHFLLSSRTVYLSREASSNFHNDTTPPTLHGSAFLVSLPSFFPT